MERIAASRYLATATSVELEAIEDPEFRRLIDPAKYGAGSARQSQRSRMATTTATADYWEPLWAGGRRYREVTSTEATLFIDHVGAGRGRPALDIGTGEGSLARRLHQFGYRTTGIDFAPVPSPQPECPARRGAHLAPDGLHRRRPQCPAGPRVCGRHLPSGLPLDRRQGSLPRPRPAGPSTRRDLLGRHRTRRPSRGR